MNNTIPTKPMDASALAPESSSQLNLWRDNFVFWRPDLPVTIQHIDQCDCALHRHEFVEIAFILRGSGWHQFGGGLQQPIRPGQFLALSGRQSHGFQKVSGTAVVNVLFRRQFLRAHQRQLATHPGIRLLFPDFPALGEGRTPPRLFQLTPDRQESCLALVHELERELRQQEPGFVLMLHGLALELLSRLGRFAAESGGGPDVVTLRRQRLHAAFELLEQHYSGTVSLEQLAQAVHLSPRSVERHFREAAGLSPIQYRLQTRLAQAARLLRETSLQVREIATRCGFGNLSYFARSFRRAAGQSPLRYRAAGNEAMDTMTRPQSGRRHRVAARKSR